MFPRLKALRLSSPRFAYLHRVQETLFSVVQLVVTPENVEHLMQVDISPIAPFVKDGQFRGAAYKLDHVIR